MTSAPEPTTGKAIAADPEVFLAWSFLIKRHELPDRGLQYSPELTEQLDDGRHAYTFPAHLESAVQRDFEHVAATYTGQTGPALWTPN